MKLMISYSHKNVGEREDLNKHLVVLKNNKNLSVWSDVDILPGKNLVDKIDENIYTADIICFLLSIDYLASKECMDEVGIALNRIKKEQINVIPIVLSAVFLPN